MNDFLSRLFGRSKFLKGNELKNKKNEIREDTGNVTIIHWHDTLQLSTQSGYGGIFYGHSLFQVVFQITASGRDQTTPILLLRYFNTSTCRQV